MKQFAIIPKSASAFSKVWAGDGFQSFGSAKVAQLVRKVTGVSIAAVAASDVELTEWLVGLRRHC